MTSTSGNFFFVYSNLDSSNALTIETGTPMTINLLGNVYTPNNIVANNFGKFTSYTATYSGDASGTFTTYYQQIGNFVFYWLPSLTWTTNNGYVDITLPVTPVSEFYTTSTSLMAFGSTAVYNMIFVEILNNSSGTYLEIATEQLVSSGTTLTVYPFVFTYPFSTS